jgi:para-aminobenzoate synthetase component 1
MSKKDEAIGRMNRLGAAGEPFLFLVDFAMERPEVLTPDEASARGVLYDINGLGNVPAPPATSGAPVRAFSFDKFPVPFPEYRRAFDAVQEELANGNSYLLNLTFPTPIETDLTLEEIFRIGGSAYRILVPGDFVCFSPEMFVRIAGGVISSRPMKGTIDASVPDARGRILSDPKELAEHTTIVDLIRNDLNGVAAGVAVERFRYVDRVATHYGDILQVSSHITGRLGADYWGRLGEILFDLLPAGSVTGAPKKKTVEIIERTEGAPRGFYTGVAGYFDGETLESCVLIRFIEQTVKGLVYRSGGGITVRSRAEAEYEELVRKVYVPAL